MGRVSKDSRVEQFHTGMVTTGMSTHKVDKMAFKEAIQ